MNCLFSSPLLSILYPHLLIFLKKVILSSDDHAVKPSVKLWWWPLNLLPKTIATINY